MAVTIIRPSSHDEWLKLRQRGIGSSEVGSILGVNPYETPYMYWCRKLGLVERPAENAAMKLGHLLEGAVATLYEEATGNKVDTSTEGDWCARSDFREYTIASPDRICVTPDGGKVLLECKTTQLNVSEDDYPKSWFCQVQYLLACTEMDEGAIAWLRNGRDFGTKRIVKNKEFQKFMFEKLDKFWTENIKGGKVPEAVSADDVLAMYPQSSHRSVAATDEIAATVMTLKEKKNLLSAITGECEELEERIKMYMGDAEELTCGLSTLCTWKTTNGRVTLDGKLLKSELPDIYDRFSKQGAPIRRFLVK